MIIFFSVLFYHRCGRSILHQDASWASPEAQWVKNLPANEEDMGLIPGIGKSPGEGKGNPFQCSCLENSMDRGSLVGYSPEGQKKSNTTEWLCMCTHTYTHKMPPFLPCFPFGAISSTKWLGQEMGPICLALFLEKWSCMHNMNVYMNYTL